MQFLKCLEVNKHTAYQCSYELVRSVIVHNYINTVLTLVSSKTIWCNMYCLIQERAWQLATLSAVRTMTSALVSLKTVSAIRPATSSLTAVEILTPHAQQQDVREADMNFCTVNYTIASSILADIYCFSTALSSSFIISNIHLIKNSSRRY